MTIESMFSPSWYRVAKLQPRLRNHTQIHRHNYRGGRWYVLQDHSTGRYHRFSPAVYYIIAQMDGQKTFQEIWDRAVEYLGDDAPTQDELIRLAGQLHSSDTLLCDVPPDTFELFQRHQKHEQVKWKQWFLSPLSIRFPLFDPERVLNKYKPLVQPLCNGFGVLVWLSVVGYAVFLAGTHWEALTHNVGDRVLTPENIFLLWLVYPIVKLLHEFGHAFAAKIWGGEVHEMGIMLLVFIPVPYVEASSASAFPEKRKRMLVDAAGILVELFLAAIALFVWVHVEQGVVHAIAYNVLLIGSVSTLLFNGNPLLRFDGYYFLADALEIPNLGSRSTNYLGYLVQRYLFGVRNAKSPANTGGERFWFLIYGVCSFCYRLFIMSVIALFVAGKFFIVGVIFACWALITMLVVPLVKRISFLIRSPAITGHRIRAISFTVVFVTLLSWFVLDVPFPYATRVEGVVWPPENALVRAGVDGFTQRLVVQPRERLRQGDPILYAADPLLATENKILKERLRELDARYASQRVDDRIKAAMTRDEMKSVKNELARVIEKESHLIIRSPADGQLILPYADDIQGRFLKKGELLGYVVNFPVNVVRVVVPQDKIGLVKDKTVKVEVRLAERVESILTAEILREVPAATDQLPSVALGFAGGGNVAVDPSDERGATSLNSVFQLDLKLSDEANIRHMGARVFVRFDHGSIPLGRQWYHSLRQLFLREFSI